MSADHRFALNPGTHIGSWEIEKLLGAGGFGLTYLCVHRVLKKKAAIKELLPNEFAFRDERTSHVVAKTSADESEFEWARERFLEEGQNLARFEHPNIVAVHDLFMANGTVYMVMDYLRGESLGERIQRTGPLSETEVCEILRPLISGLKLVHAEDLLHRDIKPDNILITEDRGPVLLDFGAARYSISARSRSVTAIISPGYAPFEQYHTDGNQGPWTDIYALGAVSYRCLTGETPPEASRRERKDPYVPLVASETEQHGLRKAVDLALIPDEEQRPQSLEEWEPIFLSPDESSDSVRQTCASIEKSTEGGVDSRILSTRVSTCLSLVSLTGLFILLMSLIDRSITGDHPTAVMIPLIVVALFAVWHAKWVQVWIWTLAVGVIKPIGYFENLEWAQSGSSTLRILVGSVSLLALAGVILSALCRNRVKAVPDTPSRKTAAMLTGIALCGLISELTARDIWRTIYWDVVYAWMPILAASYTLFLWRIRKAAINPQFVGILLMTACVFGLQHTLNRIFYLDFSIPSTGITVNRLVALVVPAIVAWFAFRTRHSKTL